MREQLVGCADVKRRRLGFVLLVIAFLVGALVAPASATVRLNNIAPAHDQLLFHGRLGPSTRNQVVDHGITVDMRNQGGIFVSFTLPAGACVPHLHGNNCVFVDKDAAKRREGIAYFKMTFDKGKIWMTAYGDLSRATTPQMDLYVTLNGAQYSLSAVFKATGRGWVLSNQNWP